MRIPLSVTLLCTLWCFSATAALAQPSFDCRRTTTATERHICATPALARLDRQLARAYDAVRQRFARDTQALAEMRDQQNQFIAHRDEAYETLNETPISVAALYRERIQVLNSHAPRQTKWIGQWSGYASEVNIVSGRGGQISVSISAVEPRNARWVCFYETSPARDVNGKLIVSFDAGSSPPAQIVIERVGSMLQVNNSDGSHYFCGNNGSVAGLYFPSQITATSNRR